MRKIAPLIAFAVILLIPGIAQAHTVTVTGSATCESDGTYTATFGYVTSNVPEGVTEVSHAWTSGDPVTGTITGIPGTTTSVSNSVSVTFSNQRTFSGSATIELAGDCEPPPPTPTPTPPPPPPSPTPPPCEPSVAHGPWYGDPRINLTLVGPGHFVVRGGVQRVRDLDTVRVDLDCDEVYELNRYKVERGHWLTVRIDGVLVLRLQSPRVRGVSLPIKPSPMPPPVG